MINVERGNRLKLCRSMLQKTLKELGKAHQISIGALSSWESGASPINEKNVDKIISMLATEGLICSKDWLLEEKGEPPYLYSSQETKRDKKTSFDLTDQFLFFKEIEAVKKAHPEMIITLVRDDSMLPFLRVGDYVGGSLLPKAALSKTQGNICIVEVEPGEFLVRQLFTQGSKILLLCTNPDEKYNFLTLDEKSLKVAPLTFMRRF